MHTALSLITARYLLIVCGVAFAILLAGCGDDDKGGYPPQVRENFISTCASTGGNREACECAWEEITDKYSYDEFVEIEDALADGSGGDELLPIIEKCFDQT